VITPPELAITQDLISTNRNTTGLHPWNGMP
jgi:hypothetical protein